MTHSLDYDRTIEILRLCLWQARGNAQGFQIRAQRQPGLLSPRAWRELAQIESMVQQTLERTLSRELHLPPWTAYVRLRAWGRVLWTAFRAEPEMVKQQLVELEHLPVKAWRAAAPQLEATLWPLLVSRTHYAANTLALALNEPAPFPPLLWHPGRHEFQS